MILDVVIFLLQLAVISAVAAFEWSVSVPLVSVALIFMYLRGHSLVWQVLFLLASSLVISAFVMSHWSTIFLILAGIWVMQTIIQQKVRWFANKTVLFSLLVTLFLSLFVKVQWQTRSFVYSLLLSICAYGLYWLFFQKKNRKRIVDWLSVGG